MADRIAPITFRLYAGRFAGTAFIISIGSGNADGYYYAIFATAWHVIAPIVDTQEDVALVSFDKSKRFDSKQDEIRVQQLGSAIHDTVLLLLKSRNQIIDQAQLAPIPPWTSQLARGAEIAWLGFPGLVEAEMCFFHGHISGYLKEPPTYLVDGVAINGVSGGPAFDNRAHLIGLVSAYLPNRIDQNTTLPGLMTLVPINTIRLFMEQNMRAKVI